LPNRQRIVPVAAYRIRDNRQLTHRLAAFRPSASDVELRRRSRHQQQINQGHALVRCIADLATDAKELVDLGRPIARAGVLPKHCDQSAPATLCRKHVATGNPLKVRFSIRCTEVGSVQEADAIHNRSSADRPLVDPKRSAQERSQKRPDPLRGHFRQWQRRRDLLEPSVFVP
jgi:hypothetical protein